MPKTLYGLPCPCIPKGKRKPCRAPTRVLSTRDGNRRRRECESGHRFSTLEVEKGELEELREHSKWVRRRTDGEQK